MIYKKFYKHATTLWFFAWVLLIGVDRCEARPIYDFDGDGRSDIAVIRFSGDNTQFTWFILQSRDGFAAKIWGYQYPDVSGLNDGPTSGDFDGDGKWDVTVRRAGSSMPNMFWFVLNSHDDSMTAQHWGLASDRLVPQDYDGDGKTDFAVYRNGWWYVLRSSDGQFQAEKFGTSNDLPFQGGDYDGDGKDDMAVVRIEGGGWRQWIRLSRSGWWKKYDLGNPQFTGVITGDYDGDGVSDVAIVQGNLWLWERSSDGQLGGGLRFGRGQQDTPVPADYDGDGKTDIAVFRDEAQHYFYVQQSRDGFLAVPWGGGGNADANLPDRRYIRPVGFRPSGLTGGQFRDKGPFPRLVEIRKN
jgi:hypothetical protein